MKTVNCEGVEYLNHETIGGAALFVRHLASLYLSGEGLDIGYSKPEWQYPGSFGIEPSLDPRYDAMNLPLGVGKGGKFNYIHSSHCLEHVKENWHNVLDYWLSKLHVGGILFLYLPHASQNYWQPRNNRKHIHSFDGPEINDYLNSLGHQSFVSGVDMNHSFTVICQKVKQKESNLADSDFILKHGIFEFDKQKSKDTNIDLTKQFFEQNNIDLQNKIKEYTEETKELSDYNVLDLVSEVEALRLMNTYGKHNISFGNITNEGLYPISAIRR